MGVGVKNTVTLEDDWKAAEGAAEKAAKRFFKVVEGRRNGQDVRCPSEPPRWRLSM